MLQREPLFVSILGSPACGKSYYLAALATTLRRQLPAHFRLDFADADMHGNQTLIDYEERIFLSENPNEFAFLGDLIPKTELGGHLYNSVDFGQQSVSYPRPFSFLLEPRADHFSEQSQRDALKRIVCLYDNAGEHFLPGNDQASAPGTRHMAQSRFLLFLFDPTQDPRWHAVVKKVNPKLAMPRTDHAGKQEGILREASGRIQRLLSRSDGQKHDRPLIVVVNKADVWKDVLPDHDWKRSPLIRSNQGYAVVHLARARECSDRLRDLLEKHLPELVYAAESFSDQVYYIPVSALGRAPTEKSQGQLFIRPADISPQWVQVPFLLGLSLVNKGLIRVYNKG